MRWYDVSVSLVDYLDYTEYDTLNPQLDSLEPGYPTSVREVHLPFVGACR